MLILYDIDGSLTVKLCDYGIQDTSDLLPNVVQIKQSLSNTHLLNIDAQQLITLFFLDFKL